MSIEIDHTGLRVGLDVTQPRMGLPHVMTLEYRNGVQSPPCATVPVRGRSAHGNHRRQVP
jgi:hypothetical protein